MSSEKTRLVVREVNAAIVELEERFGRNGQVSVLCECGRVGCMQRLVVPTPVYDEIRVHGHRFLVAEGHAVEENARAAAAEAGYHIVEARPA